MMSFSLHFMLNFINNGKSAKNRLAAKSVPPGDATFRSVFLGSVMNRLAAMEDLPGGAHWNCVN